MGKATVSNILETCQAIWEALNEEYLRPPTSTEEWKNIAKEYIELWNFPHCVGAIDGEHLAILETVALSFTTTKGFSVSSSRQCVIHIMFSPW